MEKDLKMKQGRKVVGAAENWRTTKQYVATDATATADATSADARLVDSFYATKSVYYFKGENQTF